jgi:hypothetical protein
MHVIFPRHSYTPLTKDEISVRMEDVIASVWEDDDGVPWLIPENDWVLIDRVAAEETSAGGVILPETSRRRARKGEIADVGPGLLRLEGEYQGTRAPCPAIMGQENACPEVGALVYWGPDADCPQVALAGRAWWLVKARDLLVVEVHDEEDADDA